MDQQNISGLDERQLRIYNVAKKLMQCMGEACIQERFDDNPSVITHYELRYALVCDEVSIVAELNGSQKWDSESVRLELKIRHKAALVFQLTFDGDSEESGAATIDLDRPGDWEEILEKRHQMQLRLQ